MFFHQTFWPMIRRERSYSVLPIYSMPAGVSQGEGAAHELALGVGGFVFSLSARAQYALHFTKVHVQTDLSKDDDSA